MISLTLAKELKEAKLAWEPKPNDIYYWKSETTEDVLTYGESLLKGIILPENIWIPRLEQILAEIKGRGWAWILKPGICGVMKWVEVEPGHERAYPLYTADAENEEEAAGQALLWILKGVGRDE